MTPDVASLVLRALHPLDDGVEALIEVVSPEWLRTSAYPGLAAEALRLLPGLVRHRCESKSPHGIAAELADTETPHLVEHLALELLALGGWPRETRGRTHWDFARDGKGVFRVWLACKDLDASRGALEGAIAIASWLLGHKGPQPDVALLVSDSRKKR